MRSLMMKRRIVSGSIKCEKHWRKMRIDIKNFAKIKEASVQIDGITVIAGENNTGKVQWAKYYFHCLMLR